MRLTVRCGSDVGLVWSWFRGLRESKTFKPQHQNPQSQLSFLRLPRITRASQPLNLKSFALLHDQHKKRMEAAEQKCSRPQNNLLEKGCKKATLVAIFISLCVQGKILYILKHEFYSIKYMYNCIM